MGQIVSSPDKIFSSTDDTFATATIKTLQQLIQQVAADAGYTSLGKSSCFSKSAVAWESVEELLAVKSHRP